MVSHVTAEPRVVGPLCVALGEQVNSTAKGGEVNATNALKGFEALANESMVAAEPHILAQVPVILGGEFFFFPSHISYVVFLHVVFSFPHLLTNIR